MSDHKPVLCAVCRVPVQVSPSPKPDDTVTCPRCGVEDSHANVMKSIAEQGQEYLAHKLQEAMSNAARGSKYLKYTPGSIPKRTHRFVVDLQ